MLRELLEQRIEALNSQCQTNDAKAAIDESEELGHLGMTDELYESFSNVLSAPLPFNISSFAQIGLADPLPDEPMDSELAKPRDRPTLQVEDLVYMRSRYIYDMVPNACFIPSKRMMWKLMRAGIDVDHPK